jgi:hypothetical protein
MMLIAEPGLSRALAAASITLNAAYKECFKAQLDPEPYYSQLSAFVADEVRIVVQEISLDQRAADPMFLIHLRNAGVQNVYFADAGRRAAHSLLKDLDVPHALPTTRRG